MCDNCPPDPAYVKTVENTLMAETTRLSKMYLLALDAIADGISITLEKETISQAALKVAEIVYETWGD